jgi:hypothetical protein
MKHLKIDIQMDEHNAEEEMEIAKKKIASKCLQNL